MPNALGAARSRPMSTAASEMRRANRFMDRSEPLGYREVARILSAAPRPILGDTFHATCITRPGGARMRKRERMPARVALMAIVVGALWAGFVPAAGAKGVRGSFKSFEGYASPGTPANLNRVGVLRTGEKTTKNILILNPGTSASAAYFEPLAKTIVKRLPNWQVWAVERRENLLEDQSELNLLKQGKVSPTDFFNYYLGYLSNPSVTNHVTNVPDSSVPFARQWGMNTEINDLRVVVRAADRRGNNV